MSILNSPYPHLLPVDVPCWEWFLSKYGNQFELIDYDVRVGVGRDPGPEFPDNIRTMAIDLSMKRIDAVAYMPDQIWAIEITKHAGLKALGQLIAYPLLFTLKFNPVLPVQPVLVCEDLITDMEIVYTALEMPVYASGPNPRQNKPRTGTIGTQTITTSTTPTESTRDIK